MSKGPFGSNEPPWGPEPTGMPPLVHIPQRELAEENLLFWEDKEIMESMVVGDTEYTRAYVHGTEQDAVWATRGSGQIEQVSSSEEYSLSASEMFRALTSPEAPTELGEQMQYEEELLSEVPMWADREIEIAHLLQEYPDQLDMAREALENGTLNQAEYESRIAELASFKQSLEDEQALYALERGETAAQGPMLDQPS
ncbi:hypothetical protein [Streptomyces noursei]|uniref:Uncharacterized protein n=1 Tax=Streptomyces noursei TaxID=1971 RepID=A0A2N8PQX3_STRNR|nr:hypothetical protein [Streptomyces noursei]PNE43430.1 hypothetical protein AOB60_00370 [Streptomyces noursei]